jgi:hypothetical protein
VEGFLCTNVERDEFVVEQHQNLVTWEYRRNPSRLDLKSPLRQHLLQVAAELEEHQIWVDGIGAFVDAHRPNPVLRHTNEKQLIQVVGGYYWY